MSWAHGTYLLGFIGGGLIFGISFAACSSLAGTIYPGMIMAAGIMAFSGLYIQQGLGRIEMHFHVFAGLALVTCYKSLIPLVAAVVTIAVLA